MKVSNRSALLSVLAITTLISSSIALGQQKRPEHPYNGLTPGKVIAENEQKNDDRRDLDRKRDAEVRARDEERRQQEARRIQAERIRREQQEALERRQRQQAREEFERQQRARAAQEAREAYERQQRDAYIAAQLAQAEAARLAAEAEARRIEEERQALLRRGSASINFKDVTRKTGGEWLRVYLAQPMQLFSIEIMILTAAAKTHEVVLHAENGQMFSLATNPDEIFNLNSMTQVKETSGISNRIAIIDMRVEAMGALALVNVKVNSLEGKPTLAQKKIPYKPMK